MKLKGMHITDFKGVKEASYAFGDLTKVLGPNGSGKSTIATAWYWVWSDKSYELQSNPNIRPNGVEDCIPRVELIIDFDGKEVVVAKQQKRTVSKPDSRGVSRTILTNTYEINSIPKTERDFKAYLEDEGIKFDLFLSLSHPGVFTGQKASDMRKILFSMAESKSDYDVAVLTEGCAEVADLLKQYKSEEIEAMHKASKKKAEEQVKAIPNQIIGLEKAKVNIDTAELELQSNAIKEQITELESQMADTNAQYEQWKKQSDEILQKKMDLNEYVRNANAGLVEQRSALNRELLELQQKLRDTQNDFRMAELDKQRCEHNLERHNNERDGVLVQWKEWKNKQFDESVWEFDESSLVCPMCGQNLPSGQAEKRKADFEKNRDMARDGFKKSKQQNLSDLEADGFKAAENIKIASVGINTASDKMAELSLQSGVLKKEISAKEEELATLPSEVDLSDNQEFQSMQAEVIAMEEAYNSATSATDIRNQLKITISGKKEELLSVEKKIAKASNNVDIDEQILALQTKLRDYEQSKADSEKILYQLTLVSKAKNELMVNEINSHFSVVRWILFEYQKNGEYKECCIPEIDSRKYGDATNTGREIIAKLDICNSLQKFFGMNVPVFLDGAESINDCKMPHMDCQLIALKVTEDLELRVED